MSTDIHGIFQRYDGTEWLDVDSQYDQRTDYHLFAVLAGVGNIFAFADSSTGEAAKPIAEPRGLPDDFKVQEDDGRCAHPVAKLIHTDPRRRKYLDFDSKLEVWMGEHSYSWLTGEEILRWFGSAPAFLNTGIVKRELYRSWDKKSRPLKFCGRIFGQDVLVVQDNLVSMRNTPLWTHVEVQWEEDHKEELSYFFNEVQRLVNLHGSVRFVFGFDS